MGTRTAASSAVAGSAVAGSAGSGRAPAAPLRARSAWRAPAQMARNAPSLEAGDRMLTKNVTTSAELAE